MIEVWESQAAWERFRDERLAGALDHSLRLRETDTTVRDLMVQRLFLAYELDSKEGTRLWLRKWSASVFKLKGMPMATSRPWDVPEGLWELVGPLLPRATRRFSVLRTTSSGGR